MPVILFAIGAIWLVSLFLLRKQNITYRANARHISLYYEDLLAGGLLFLLTIGFFWRTLSGDVYQPADGGDLVSFLYPIYRFAASQLSQWSLPLWNPHLYGGAPFISDIQAGFLYPPNLLLFLSTPDFSYTTMQWMVQLHIFWAGLGVYVLVRTLRFGNRQPSRPAAFLAAVAFQFSDPFLIHLGNYNLIAVLSWLGWILAAYTQAIRTRRLHWVAITGLLFGVANYAGHAQSTMYVGLALAIYTILHLFKHSQTDRLPPEQSQADLSQADPNERASTAKLRWQFEPHVLAYAAFVLLLTLLLSAPILLPALEMTQFTERADLSYQETIAYSLAPTQAIGVLTPSFFGRGPALHWGLWDRVETPYAGIVTLLLAIAGLIFATKKQRRDLWPWIGLAMFGFVTALGVYGIFHGWLTMLLPGFDQFRAPARALILWTLGLSVVAAVGLDSLSWAEQNLTKESRRLRAFESTLKYVGLVLLGVAMPLMYMTLLLTQDDPTRFLRASVASLAISVATFFWLATWVTILATRGGWISLKLLPYLAIGLLFLELTSNGGSYLDISSDDPTRGYQQAEIVSFLKSDPDLFRIDTRTDIERFWQPDAAAFHGLQDVAGIANPLLLTHWSRLWDSTGGRQTWQYDMLNVKYVLVEDGVPLPEGKFELALDAEGELSVYRNVDFVPRAWLVHGAQAAATVDESFSLITAAEFDPLAEVVLLDGDATEIDDTVAGEKSAMLGGESVTITHFGSSELTVQATVAAPAYLVLSEVWFPGWHATVNGLRVDVERANGALRAVALAPGQSTVRFWFTPARWSWGLAALVLGLALMGVLGFAEAWLRRSRFSRRKKEPIPKQEIAREQTVRAQGAKKKSAKGATDREALLEDEAPRKFSIKEMTTRELNVKELSKRVYKRAVGDNED